VVLNTGTGLKYPDTVVTPVTAAAAPPAILAR
jgi:hypothetical protein